MDRTSFTWSCSLVPFGFGASVLLIVLLEWLAPGVIPFELTTFWVVPPDLWAAFTGALLLAWPVLAAGVLLTLIFLPRIRPVQRQLAWYGTDEGRVVRLGPMTAVIRSALEEITFRWLLFYAGIAGALGLDFLLLGFADLHPVRWFFTEIMIPVADFATAGHLHAILTDHPWTVAAALLSTNGKFRDGHAYQGLPGWIWSWYFGMFLFLIMFQHGLILAIAVHIAYNLTILALHLTIVGTVPRLVLPY
ncbi:hypothetical protein Misp01_53380 [Microtetraspora sp. NBRC 13810]|uniref:hypothetical protein n=1 Tax=Microtetraspora sp. NBRC 13810 TaxID=3030990 RepID=UPI002552A092|nr:hypothetical protein [Microtetraspora sp. NBRC 13810]GLW10210.1 hypothetical protein Misp01_53380 [Microtetraspora sp. NBRC 13810]